MPDLVTPNGRGMGWRPAGPDHLRLKRFASAEPVGALPSSGGICQTGFLPPIWDQGQTSSCTGHAAARCVAYDRAMQNLPDAGRTPARLMAYYDGRMARGNQGSDSGAIIGDVFEAISTQGVCFEDGDDGWPFDPSKVLVRPADNCYAAALKDQAIDRSAVPQDINYIRACLNAKYPVAFGISVFAALDGADCARGAPVPMPQPGEPVLGGHAIVAVWYDDPSRYFLINNSWGAGWGLHGSFWLPYDYAADPSLSSDFQMIRSMEPA
jgi:hypothetical protein